MANVTGSFARGFTQHRFQALCRRDAGADDDNGGGDQALPNDQSKQRTPLSADRGSKFKTPARPTP